ncbi:MAG: tetratricopeptide repeat protein [Polyangiaceae bacterium]
MNGQRALPWLLAGACVVYDPAALAAEPKRCAGLLLMLAVALWFSLRPGSLPRFAGALGPLLLFAVWLALSALWGASGRWLVLGNWWLLLAPAVLGTALAREGALAIAKRTALVVCVVVSAWLTLDWARGAHGMQLHAGLGNPNWAGLLLCVCWPLGASDPWLAKRPLGPLLLAVFVAFALALSESRVAWLAAALAFTVSLAVAPSSLARLACALGLVMLCVSVGVATWRASASAPPAPQTSAAVRTRSGPLVDHSARASLTGRLWIQRIALRSVLDELPFGVGLGGFYSTFLVEQGQALSRLTPAEASRRFSNATTAHGDWLELLVEAGPLAPLLLLLAFARALAEHARAREFGAVGGLVAATVSALADSPFHLPSVCLCLGLLFVGEPRVGGVRAARSLFALSLILSGFLLARSLGAWLSERASTTALGEAPEARCRSLARARRLDPDSSERALELGLARRDLGQLVAATRELQSAVTLGGDVATHLALATVYVDARRFPDALTWFERARALNPGSVRAHAGLSVALAELGRPSEAEAHARIAAQLLPGDPTLRVRLDAIRELLLDRELDQP